MIQAGEESSVEMMYRLCKRIYQEKSCPADWGKAIIVPITKKKTIETATTTGELAY